MATLLVHKTEQLKGTAEAPPSKSYTHRAVIASSLADGISKTINPLISDDTLATVDVCRKLGAKIDLHYAKWIIKGASGFSKSPGILDCQESASTIRFMIPVSALAQGIAILTGGPSLSERPMGPLLQALSQLGVKCYSANENGYPPIVVFGGGITGGEVAMPGDISSQFISGLLFACPLAKEETKLKLTTQLESKPYVQMTLKVLEKHGIVVDASKDLQRYRIPPGQNYKPANHIVPGDFSAAAFLMAAAAITGSKISISNLCPNSTQGDEAILDILKSMGAGIEVKEKQVEVCGGSLRGINIDAKDIPDLVPVCAALACYAEGKTHIFNARRLRLKESDRLAAIHTELTKMGGRIVEREDSLIIDGPSPLHGTEVDPHDDHRIAMACAIAALNAKGATSIKNSECINKSYPNFIRDLKTLGGKVNVQ